MSGFLISIRLTSLIVAAQRIWKEKLLWVIVIFQLVVNWCNAHKRLKSRKITLLFVFSTKQFIFLYCPCGDSLADTINHKNVDFIGERDWKKKNRLSWVWIDSIYLHDERMNYIWDFKRIPNSFKDFFPI